MFAHRIVFGTSEDILSIISSRVSLILLRLRETELTDLPTLLASEVRVLAPDNLMERIKSLRDLVAGVWATGRMEHKAEYSTLKPSASRYSSRTLPIIW